MSIAIGIKNVLGDVVQVHDNAAYARISDDNGGYLDVRYDRAREAWIVVPSSLGIVFKQRIIVEAP